MHRIVTGIIGSRIRKKLGNPTGMLAAKPQHIK